MGAITKAADQAANTPKQVTPQQAIVAGLNMYKSNIGHLLRKTGLDEQEFIAQIKNACRVTPALFRCEPDTVIGAALRAAQLGLTPNDPRNLCWIIPYGNKAQFQLGYGGILELARRAVPGLRFDGRPVFPNDEFDLDYGKADPLVHRPSVVRGMDRGGEAYAWYVRAIFPDGQVQIHVLDKQGVEYHRSFSKNANTGMWKDNYDAAALKSVVTDMKRWLPSSTSMAVAFASDEAVLDVAAVEEETIEVGEVDHTPVESTPSQDSPE